jgi:hypothetical protein
MGWLENLSKHEIQENTRKFSLLTNFVQLNSLKSQFLIYFVWICVILVFWYFHSLNFKAWHWSCQNKIILWK